MALPVQRVPVRIARGTKANLDTALAAGDLFEGELCYATDESRLYTINSSALVSLGQPTGLSSDTGAAGANTLAVTNIVAITDTDYASLATPDPSTIYMIYQDV